MSRDSILQKYFCSSRIQTDDAEVERIQLFFDIIYDEINALSADNEDDAAAKTTAKFDRIIEVFDASKKAKDTFLDGFLEWSRSCVDGIQSLKQFADEMQKDKLNSSIAQVAGGLVGVAGTILVGLSFIPPLAPVTVPLAIAGGVATGVGGGVMGGTKVTEFVLAKNRLEKVKAVIEKQKEKCTHIAEWFTCPEELENAINDLLDYDVFLEVAQLTEEFLLERPDLREATYDEYVQELKSFLKICIGIMNRDQTLISEYGKEGAIAVLTFVLAVCLLRSKNLMVLDCAVVTQRLAMDMADGLVSLPDLKTGRFAGKGVASAVSKFIVAELLLSLSAAVGAVDVITAFMDIHERADAEHTKKIKEVTEQFERLFLFIDRVYKETIEYKNIKTIKWVSAIINRVPVNAEMEDLKGAVREHIPQVLGRIRFERLPTKGNNWVVKIPEAYEAELMKLKRVKIKGLNCKITK